MAKSIVFAIYFVLLTTSVMELLMAQETCYDDYPLPSCTKDSCDQMCHFRFGNGYGECKRLEQCRCHYYCPPPLDKLEHDMNRDVTSLSYTLNKN